MIVSMERKTRAGAWKHAADEIVGLLKSVREEGTFRKYWNSFLLQLPGNLEGTEWWTDSPSRPLGLLQQWK